MDSSSNLPDPAAGTPATPSDKAQTEVPGRMTLGEIFSKAFEVYRNNPIMIAPSLLPIAVSILGLLLFAGFIGAAAILGGGGGGFLAVSAIGGLLLFMIVLIVSFFVAEGVTIEMIKEASAGNRADINSAWESSKGRMEPLILSSILAGIITVLGYLLLIIPGIILSFIFYFVAQAVMIDGRSGMDALKTSYGFVKENLSDAVILILVSMVLSIVLSVIPLIGPLLCLLVIPYIYALATLFYLDRMEVPEARSETRVEVA
jgi:hypothetical protein